MEILKTGLLGGIILLAGCNMQEMGEKQGQRLEDMAADFQLTADEFDTAKALIAGFKTEMGTPVVRSRDLSHAVCYATHVHMPDKYYKAHMLYLEHYPEADKDYYGWFKKQGISGADAEAMGNIYLKAFNDCKSLPSRMEILKKIKEERGG